MHLSPISSTSPDLQPGTHALLRVDGIPLMVRVTDRHDSDIDVDFGGDKPLALTLGNAPDDTVLFR